MDVFTSIRRTCSGSSRTETAGRFFPDTREAMAKKHEQFVLLIDEYDVPLIELFPQAGELRAGRSCGMMLTTKGASP